MTEHNQKTHTPRVYWDWGTAYDLFISLMVLHKPAKFGLRAAWAAGMRSRLPTQERETLEAFEQMVLDPLLPYPWIYHLPEPKDARTVLDQLEGIPPAERPLALTRWPGMPQEVGEVLQSTADSGAWGEAAIETLHAFFAEHEDHEKAKPEQIEQILGWIARSEQSGEQLLAALRAYYEVFFAEEENRIRPALQAGLERAQDLAENVPLLDLLEQLSEGVRLDQGFDKPEIVLAPTYWGTPLLYFGEVTEQREIILFGARPKEASLVPGEAVPDALLQALKALSDPTRLRILRYLADEPLTPTQLAQRLRLRASTVVHHLLQLRLATLVQLRVGDGKERRYAARKEAIAQIFANLEGFQQGDGEEPQPQELKAEVAAEVR